MHVIVHENTGARLCKDSLFRTFACFGTFPECVKVWKSEAWARRRQDKLDRLGIETAVVTVPKDQTMDAAGNISRKDNQM